MIRKSQSIFFKILCILFVIPQAARAQEFIKSQGMLYFNQGNYSAAVTEINNWIPAHPGEEAIAKYYMAEAFYNIAMTERQARSARQNFVLAHQYFQEALSYSDLKRKYDKLYYSSQLKTGWCFFRRAETGERPVDLLNVAYNSFRSFDLGAPDSLKLQVHFLAGESRYRAGLISRFDSFWPGTSPEKVNATLSLFRDSEQSYQKVLQISSGSEGVRFITEIRLADVKYELGKIYQSVEESLFRRIQDDAKGPSARETALALFGEIDYPAIIGKYKAGLRSSFGEFMRYDQGTVLLNKYFITFDQNDKQAALDHFSKVSSGIYENELRFREGNADHNTDQIDGNDRFSALVQNDRRSFYFQLLSGPGAAEYLEGYFWLGSVQFIANRNTGIDNFQSYIKQTIGTTEPRITALLEHAQYWRGVLFLEANRDNRGKLRELKQLLVNFDPRNQELAEQKDLLLKLTQLELGEDVRADILGGRGMTEAVEMIQYLLRRASSVVGINRVHYLRQLDKLFSITRTEMTNETYFYDGIAKSLEAEIQGDEDEQERLFSASAELLSKVGEPFADEASYIRGRSLFFASRGTRDWSRSKGVLKRVINEKRSLRSLFYFAEILRENGFGDAAKQCYEVIKEKTRDNPDGRFWFLNAEAGINLCVNRADGSSELVGLNYQDVNFPEQLLAEQANSYEELADRKFLRFQRLQRSLELLRKFSMPKKNLYALASAPRTSIFKKGSVGSLPGFLNEMLRKETSSLELFVLLPEGVSQLVSVTLNQAELIPLGDNRFKSETLDLGEVVLLEIRKQDSYLHLEAVEIVTPGKQSHFVPLTERVKFTPSAQAGAPLNHAGFEMRLDRNMIMQNNARKIPDGSELMNDLYRQIDLRDATYSSRHNQFLVVNSKLRNGLELYDELGRRIEDEETLSLDLSNYDAEELDEPEGIAVDRNGNIYISDFAAHRVVVFDTSGNYLYHFGSAGNNSSLEEGEEARFMYPTRVTIEEDQEGVSFTDRNNESQTAYRNSYIFVADRNGIYRCDLRGHYLETVLEAGNVDIIAGGIYPLAIENYGRSAKLFMGVRESSELRSYVATPLQ